MEIRRFYRMTEHPHVGCEPPRAYYIPFGPGEEAAGNRETSSRFLSLNGTWDFRFFENVEALELEDPAFPAGVACNETMEVPFCWQLCVGRGYDPPNYINQDYPFPVDPPHLPDIIPCGFYRRRLPVHKTAGKRYYLNFDGVSSCFYLWVNGVWLGYSQVSHANSEFDVTAALVDGENTFEALVIKHCTGTYMEDQDFFRLSGIFRDVYLLVRDEVHIDDIELLPEVSPEFSEASLTVRWAAGVPATVRLFDPAGVPVGCAAQAAGETLFSLSSPVLWNPEQPRLYRLEIKAGEESIFFPVGFKRAEIIEKCLLLNGKKLKLLGINRHDSSPETGYYVSPAQMLEELYLLKRANVNTIRTSHYPNDPRFLRLCDELGFLLIDEADLETHGMGYNYGDWYWDYWSHICDTPLWKAQCVDRAARLYERDKNHASVLFWSLGNESGCGENHRAMAAYIRSRSKTALIHYENARLEYGARVGRDFSDISDVESRMYASLDYLEEYLNDPKQYKPFFYCEYVSAWSTGDIPLHWKDFEQYDNYCGGCVWELTDHAVNIGTKEAPRYRYGGDFGDYPNDGISCLDGLVHPDRRPRPGYYDMKDCYQPFEITYENGSVTVFNKRYYTDLSDLSLRWAVEKDGKVLFGGRIGETEIPPRERAVYPLFSQPVPAGFVTLNVYAELKADAPWAKAGYEVGHRQFILQNAPVALPTAEKKEALLIEESRTQITVKCGKTRYVFDKTRGLIRAVFRGETLVAEDVGLSVFRPWLPNSGNRAMWERARYDHAKQKCYSVMLTEHTPEKAVIRMNLSFAAPAMPPAVRADVTFTVTAEGLLRTDVRAGVTGNAPPLPRFGFAFAIPGEFDRMTYLGFGPQETYPDRFVSGMLREYTAGVRESFEHYVRPTECGAHYGTKIASVQNAAGAGLQAADLSERGFLFTARPYSDETLHLTAHDDALPPPEKTWVRLDYKMHADNPGFADREPWRRFDEKEFTFAFVFQVL